jgi:predicted ATPase
MFLKRLVLENVRCFKSLDIDFELPGGQNRKWTVLLGENGSGKSTVLRAIALMLAGSDALPEVLGEPQDWVREGAKHARIDLEIETAKGEDRDLTLSFGPNESVSRIISNSLKGLAPLNNALEHASRNYFTAAYGATRRLGAGRIDLNESGRFRHLRARALATLFDRDSELNPLESWAMDLDYRDSEGLQTVRGVLSDFLPGLTFAGIDKRRRHLVFDTPDGAVPLQQLSEGYQNVAAWIGDLLFRVTETFEDYRAPLNARGVLIIDEVDLHLHPVWQRRLISFLDNKLKNLQLVVTTHSAVTAQQAGPEAIHVLRRGRQGVQIEKFESNPGELLVSQLLMTDAFGLETDESLEVEKKKKRHQKLTKMSKLTAKQQSELKRLERQLGALEGTTPSRPTLHKDQVELLRRLEGEIKGGRQ